MTIERNKWKDIQFYTGFEYVFPKARGFVDSVNNGFGVQ